MNVLYSLSANGKYDGFQAVIVIGKFSKMDIFSVKLIAAVILLVSLVTSTNFHLMSHQTGEGSGNGEMCSGNAPRQPPNDRKCHGKSQGTLSKILKNKKI
jgi:hypothetical protein